MLKLLSAKRGASVALECAQRMRRFFRDVTYGNIPRTFAIHSPKDEDLIEYIPDVHSYCRPGCNDSTHREF